MSYHHRFLPLITGISFLALSAVSLHAETIEGQRAIGLIQNGEVLGSHFSERALTWIFVINFNGMMWQCNLAMSQATWRASCVNGTG